MHHSTAVMFLVSFLGCIPSTSASPAAAPAAQVQHPPVFNMTVHFHAKPDCAGTAVSRLITEKQGCTDSPIAFASYSTCVAPDQRFQVGPSPAPGCILYTYPGKGCTAPTRNDVVYHQVLKREECVKKVAPKGIAQSFLLQCNHFS